MVEVLFQAFRTILRYEAGGIFIFCHVNSMFVENFEKPYFRRMKLLYFVKLIPL